MMKIKTKLFVQKTTTKDLNQIKETNRTVN